MTQEQAISYAIEHEGIDVITEPRFVNYLNDLQTCLLYTSDAADD